MRIVIGVTDSVSAVLIQGQAKFLRENGFEVAVLSSEGQEMIRLAEKEGCQFYPLPFHREISIVKDAKALIQAVKFIRSFKPDIVNAGTPKAGFILMVAAYLCRVPVRIFTLRGIRSSSIKGLKKSIVELTEKISCKLANRIIAISPSLKTEAVKLNLVKESKCIVFQKGSSNGINLKKFSDSPDSSFTREQKVKYMIEDDAFVIGFVGRLVKEKGVAELYQAFIELREQYKIKLLLIGPEEVDDALPIAVIENLKNDSDVVLVGKVSEVQVFYPLMDLLVLPSYREGFGNVIIESAAMGIPAVASDISGCRDAIEDNFSGLLFKSKSVSDLKVKIEYYISHPEERAQHGINARKRALTFFPNEVIWNEQLNLYEKLYNEA